MASASRSVDTAPLAALSFTLGLLTTAVLSGSGAPNSFAIGILALVAMTTAAFGRPAGALAVAIAPAMFADHFFVAPYDSINLAPRDLAVIVGIPLAAVAATLLVRAFMLGSAFIARQRSYRMTPGDRWLLSRAHAAHLSTERRSVD
jgi:hypothetical protein